MNRFFGLAGFLVLGLGLIITLGGWAGDDTNPQPLKKLNPGGDKTPADTPLKKLDLNDPPPPKDQPKPADPPKVNTPPKGEAAQPLKGEGEDPKEVIARVTKNMETAEDHLKNGKTGKDTQTIQKKIV